MCCDEVTDPCKRSEKRKQNKQMEKFKELSIEEMQEVDGGLTWAALAGAVAMGLLLEAMMNPKSTIDAIKGGWDRAGELEKYAEL